MDKIAISASLLLLVSCTNSKVPELKEYIRPSAFELVLKTDFEAETTHGTPADAHDHVAFKNLASPRESNLPIGDENTFTINYEAGTLADRYARLTPDPVDPENQVLHFWLRNAVIPGGYQSHTKGRIQTAINPRDVGAELQSFYSKYRLYLHPDLSLLKTYPRDGEQFWSDIIIQQMWMGFEGEPAPAEISVHVGPDPITGVLRLAASCSDTVSESFWGVANLEIELPVGEWLTFETGYKMGDSKSGRFKMVIDSPSLNGPVTAIEVTDVTYNPKAAQPVGLSHWQPLKLYASDNVVHFIRDQGGVTQLYWDDFEFSETWPPDWK